MSKYKIPIRQKTERIDFPQTSLVNTDVTKPTEGLFRDADYIIRPDDAAPSWLNANLDEQTEAIDESATSETAVKESISALETAIDAASEQKSTEEPASNSEAEPAQDTVEITEDRIIPDRAIALTTNEDGSTVVSEIDPTEQRIFIQENDVPRDANGEALGIIVRYNERGEEIERRVMPVSQLPPLSEFVPLERLFDDEGNPIPITPPPPAPPTPEEMQRANLEIKRVEKEIKRDLSPQERLIVENRYLGRTLSDLNARSKAIYDQYEKSVSSTKWQKIGRAIKNVLTSAAIGAGVRMTLHAAFPVIGHFVGTIAGAGVGAFLGYQRAKEAEVRRLHSSQAIFEQYMAIKNETRDPESKKNALAFLQTFLEGGRFKGNLSQLIDIIAFYEKEAAGAFGADQITNTALGTLQANGQSFVNNYETSIPAAINNKKLWDAAIRGAKIGAGFGAVSDLVGGWLSYSHGEHAKEAYTLHNTGPAHQYDLLNEQPVQNVVGMEPGHLQELARLGVHTNTSDYGNALSHAMKIGLDPNHGNLHFPKWVEDLPRDQYDKVVHRFFQDLNHAQPASDNAFVAHNGIYHFNHGASQSLIDNAFGSQGWNLERYAHAIANADDIMTREFAVTLGHQAAEAGAKAAAEGLAEGMIQGAAIGAGIGLSAEKNAPKSADGIIGNAGEPEGGTDETAAAATGEATAAAGGGPTGEELEIDEITGQEPTEEISWESLGGDLQSTAQRVIGELARDGWEALDDNQKKNLENLFKFAKDKEYNLALNKSGTQLGNVSSLENANDARQLIFKRPKGIEGINDLIIDLKVKDQTDGLQLTSLTKRAQKTQKGQSGGKGQNRGPKNKGRNSKKGPKGRP